VSWAQGWDGGAVGGRVGDQWWHEMQELYIFMPNVIL
jgi:hypothetical protein